MTASAPSEAKAIAGAVDAILGNEPDNPLAHRFVIAWAPAGSDLTTTEGVLVMSNAADGGPDAMALLRAAIGTIQEEGEPESFEAGARLDA